MCTKCQMFKWISCNFCHRTIIIFIAVGTKLIPAVKCLKLTSCIFLSQCKLYCHNFEDCYEVILTTQLMQERHDNTFATFGTYYLLPRPHKHFKIDFTPKLSSQQHIQYESNLINIFHNFVSIFGGSWRSVC